jgi:hypothetical protein
VLSPRAPGAVGMKISFVHHLAQYTACSPIHAAVPAHCSHITTFQKPSSVFTTIGKLKLSKAPEQNTISKRCAAGQSYATDSTFAMPLALQCRLTGEVGAYWS